MLIVLPPAPPPPLPITAYTIVPYTVGAYVGGSMSVIYAGQPVWLMNYTGSVANPTGGFRDNTGTLVDPSTITLSVRTPNGTVTTYNAGQLTKDAVGLYHLPTDTTGQPGWWRFAWSSTGPQTYEPLSFSVTPAPL